MYNTETKELRDRASAIVERAIRIERKQDLTYWVRNGRRDLALSRIKNRARSAMNILRPSRNPQFDKELFDECAEWVLSTKVDGNNADTTDGVYGYQTIS